MIKQLHNKTLGMMFSAVAGASSLGCGVAPGLAEPLEDRTTYYVGGWGCHNCRYRNSPFLGQHDLSNFSLAASWTGNGLVLLGIEDPGGTMHDARFELDRLQAQTPGGIVEGVGLVGWTLVFATKSDSDLRVEVLSHLVHPDWVGGDLIDTYGLAYQSPLGPGEYELVEVCPGLGLDDTNVLFIAEETYDNETNEVNPSVSGTITVGCRGHAVSKLRFLGHGPNDNYGSAPENRQGALRMLTADYCGDGTSYTTVGHPLDWADELGNFGAPPVPSVDQMEARWDENGALCLNAPRNPQYDREDIHCGLPECEGDPEDLEGGRWASYHAP